MDRLDNKEIEIKVSQYYEDYPVWKIAKDRISKLLKEGNGRE